MNKNESVLYFHQRGPYQSIISYFIIIIRIDRALQKYYLVRFEMLFKKKCQRKMNQLKLQLKSINSDKDLKVFWTVKYGGALAWLESTKQINFLRNRKYSIFNVENLFFLFKS